MKEGDPALLASTTNPSGDNPAREGLRRDMSKLGRSRGGRVDERERERERRSVKARAGCAGGAHVDVVAGSLQT